MKEKGEMTRMRYRNGGVRVIRRNSVQSGVDLNSGGVNQYPACLCLPTCLPGWLAGWLAACSVRFTVTVATRLLPLLKYDPRRFLDFSVSRVRGYTTIREGWPGLSFKARDVKFRSAKPHYDPNRPAVDSSDGVGQGVIAFVTPRV